MNLFGHCRPSSSPLSPLLILGPFWLPLPQGAGRLCKKNSLGSYPKSGVLVSSVLTNSWGDCRLPSPTPLSPPEHTRHLTLYLARGSSNGPILDGWSHSDQVRGGELLRALFALHPQPGTAEGCNRSARMALRAEFQSVFDSHWKCALKDPPGMLLCDLRTVFCWCAGVAEG